MINKNIQEWARRVIDRLVIPLGEAGVTPNQITLCGFVLSFPAALLIASGLHLWAGLAVTVASLFDMLDGSLARVTNKESEFGAFLDSLLDRYVEICYYGGLVWFYSASVDKMHMVVLSLACLGGSVMVSYARARAEGLGLDAKVGWLQRPERLVALAVALLIGSWFLEVILWFVAIATNLTVVQRLLHVRQQME